MDEEKITQVAVNRLAGRVGTLEAQNAFLAAQLADRDEQIKVLQADKEALQKKTGEEGDDDGEAEATDTDA